jgi:beta-galactosidase
LNAVKALDRSRPVHYEPFGIGAKNPADLDSRMYTSPAEVEKIATADDKYTKPFYMCEYSHAMFNSMGALGEYNDIFDKYPNLMGGAIWEWEDQGIWNRRDPQRQFIAFGGGFGDFPNDHYFIHKGVIFSDRSPKPHYPEMKHVYQWIAVAPEDLAAGKIKIRNKYAFLNLDQFKGGWTLSEDGTVIEHGSLPALNLAPGEERVVSIKTKKFSAKPGAEYDLRVSFTLAREEKWAKAGYEIASDQFRWPVENRATAANAADMPPVKVDDGADTIAIRGDGFAVSFSKSEGTISQLSRDGKNLLISGGGPMLHLWRAPHRDDDMWAYKSWHSYGLDELAWTVQSITVTQAAPSTARVEATLHAEGKNGFNVTHTAFYTVYGDGSIAVDNVVQPQGRRIPLARMGVQMQLAKQSDRFTYFGRGPMENYADRKRGSDVGLYSSSVGEQLTPYAKPMECGNHQDVRWAALSGEGRPTLMVQADQTNLQVSALPYTDEVMTPVEYSVDLPPSASTVLTIAGRTLGVGSAGCGPRPLEQYIVWSDSAAFSYVLRLLPPGKTSLAAIGRSATPADRVRPSASLLGLATKVPLGKIVAASSFEPGEGDPQHALDGNPSTFWHSRWSDDEAQPPHFLVIDYGRPLEISGLLYTARTDGENGHVKDYEVYASDDGKEWNSPVVTGSFDRDADASTIQFPNPIKARYLKFVVLSEQEGRAFASVAELEVIQASHDLHTALNKTSSTNTR